MRCRPALAPTLSLKLHLDEREPYRPYSMLNRRRPCVRSAPRRCQRSADLAWWLRISELSLPRLEACCSLGCPATTLKASSAPAPSRSARSGTSTRVFGRGPSSCVHLRNFEIHECCFSHLDRNKRFTLLNGTIEGLGVRSAQSATESKDPTGRLSTLSETLLGALKAAHPKLFGALGAEEEASRRISRKCSRASRAWRSSGGAAERRSGGAAERRAERPLRPSPDWRVPGSSASSDPPCWGPRPRPRCT